MQWQHAPSWDELIDRFGSDAPDGVRLAVVSKIQNRSPAAPDVASRLSSSSAPRSLKMSTFIADLEAGIGTLTRLADERVDTVLIVVEPTPKSMEVGSRAASVAREKSLGDVIVVASRVQSPEDLDAVQAAFPGIEVVAVPCAVPVPCATPSPIWPSRPTGGTG